MEILLKRAHWIQGGSYWRHVHSTCIHEYMHTCIHAYMHTCILAYLHTCIHAYMPTCITAYLHTCILAYLHTYMIAYAYLNTCILVGFKINTLVFPSTWHVRSHHKKFQPSRPTRMPSTGYLYFQ